jgi:hypothetical protein
MCFQNHATRFHYSDTHLLQYGNIGVKILYAAVLRDVFGFPPLETRVGKITWIIMGECYDSNNFARCRNAKFYTQYRFTGPAPSSSPLLFRKSAISAP